MAEFKAVLPPEGINSLRENPLGNLAILVAGVLLLIGIGYYSLGFLAEYMVGELSPENEKKIAEFLISNNIIPKSDDKSNDPAEIAVKKLGADLWKPYIKLNPNKSRKRLVPSFGIQKMDSPNAFTYPGGTIRVSSGLLDKTETENELAFVICHEIGHYYHRHPLRQMGRSLVFLVASSMIELTTSTGGILTSGLHLTSLSHSRSQEQKADSFALECLQERYGHVYGFEPFFQILSKEEGGLSSSKILKYASTHPLSEDRIETLIMEAKDKGYSLDGVTNPIAPYQKFIGIKKKDTGFLGKQGHQE